MVKRQLNLKWTVIIILLVIILNVIYNFLNPSMDSVVKYAEHEWRYFAGQNALDLTNFRRPIIDLSNKKYYIFRWQEITKRDSVIYEVNINRDHSEEAFVTGDIPK